MTEKVIAFWHIIQEWISPVALGIAVFFEAYGFQITAGFFSVLAAFWYRQKMEIELTLKQKRKVIAMYMISGWIVYEALSEQFTNHFLQLIATIGGSTVILEVAPLVLAASTPLFIDALAKKLGVKK